MKNKVKIIADSASDIIRSMAEELDITVLPLQVWFGDKSYHDYHELDSEKFFDLLESSGEIPSTSLIKPELIEQEFKKNLEHYEHQIFITLSAASSGTFQSAQLVIQQLQHEYDRELPITVIDSKTLSAGAAMLAENAAIASFEGKPVQEIIGICEHLRDSMKTIISVSSLKYLAKGGRISTGSAIVGEMLNVKPMLTIKDGLVAQIGKERGKKRVREHIVNYVLQNVKHPEQSQLWFMHGRNYDEIKLIHDEIVEKLHPAKTRIADVGGVIGTHTGPGVIAVSFNAC